MMSDEEMINHIAKLYGTFDTVLLYNQNFPKEYDFIRLMPDIEAFRGANMENIVQRKDNIGKYILFENYESFNVYRHTDGNKIVITFSSNIKHESFILKQAKKKYKKDSQTVTP